MPVSRPGREDRVAATAPESPDTTPAGPVRSHRRRRATAITAALAGLGLVVSLVIAPGSSQAAPPPNPSNKQLAAAKAQKAQVGQQVGQLSAQVVSLQTKLSRLRANAEIAEQKVALAIQQLQEAQSAATAAQTQVKTAQAAIDKAHRDFVQFMRASYMNGPNTGSAGELLVADNPDDLLQHNADVHYTAAHQVNAIAALDRASIAKSNADAAARGAVAHEQQAKTKADIAKSQADPAAELAAKQAQQVQASLVSAQNQLQAAQAHLATLNNQRATYDAYVREQARKAAAAAAAAAAARLAAERANQNRGGGGGGVSVAPNPTGQWTPALGRTAVNRAASYLGWPYSFAAGDYDGPTYGVAVDFDSRNDGHVYGFDCSGLTLYAWAPYIHMSHNAALQYYEAGSVHPDIASLTPGDLVFWSEDGTAAGIGHVAIYIGNGNVIQAPFSGAFIEVTPIGQVEDGYFGATRPLT